MASVQYTLVLGVDAQHLWQLSKTYPTWRKHKPGLMDAPLVIFFDREQVKESDIKAVIRREAELISWPPDGVKYSGNPDDKWTNPQRGKMLAGFIHVPAMTVATDYWLKLDTDVVATGCANWVKGSWFDDSPAIVCHRWGFTRPPDQMVQLDQWVQENRQKVGLIGSKPPLQLIPKPGADRLRHGRIISWCGFFCTALTKYASQAAASVCGIGQIPVPSQDGYIWYVAKRLGLTIHTPNMKNLGWQHWSSNRAIEDRSKEAMKMVGP